MQLDGMVKARVEKENLRHIALMAREAMNRRGAELSPVDGARLWIWSDLHFDDERIRRNAKRSFRSISAMNGTLRDHWREAVAPGDTVVYPGTSAADATSSVAGSRPASTSRAGRSWFSATTISHGSDGGSTRWGSMFQ